MPLNKRQRTVIVGAGPVGALAAIYAAQRGHHVEVYELRGDLRDPEVTPLNFTRSINLAVSERGINSLRLTKRPGLVEDILKDTFPMHARMIHGEKGGELFEQSQNYDINGNAIMAADRGFLNKRLLDELENMPNVSLFFNHKLTGADFTSRLAWFERQDLTAPVTHSSPHNASNRRRPEIEVGFDFMIGADGAHSAVRFHLMKFARVSYRQDYIDTLWCEFHVPAAPDHGFRLSPRHLHIWPASPSMFIAIPNPDRTFTATLFMPVAAFARLSSSPEAELVPFFQKHFPGVVPDLISPADLLAQYTSNPHLPLISIKCSPYHYAAACVIVGDAAHAMVPFYGQGMNAGLEDVRELFDTLDQHPCASSSSSSSDSDSDARRAALAAYTAKRVPSAHAINDLAMLNYVEMCSSVRSPLYLLRKRLEETLSVRAPWLGFATQYARVSFSNIPYADVVRVQAHQTKLLEAAGVAVGLATAAAVAWAVRRLGAWSARAC